MATDEFTEEMMLDSRNSIMASSFVVCSSWIHPGSGAAALNFAIILMVVLFRCEKK